MITVLPCEWLSLLRDGCWWWRRRWLGMGDGGCELWMANGNFRCELRWIVNGWTSVNEGKEKIFGKQNAAFCLCVLIFRSLTQDLTRCKYHFQCIYYYFYFSWDLSNCDLMVNSCFILCQKREAPRISLAPTSRSLYAHVLMYCTLNHCVKKERLWLPNMPCTN